MHHLPQALLAVPKEVGAQHLQGGSGGVSGAVPRQDDAAGYLPLELARDRPSHCSEGKAKASAADIFYVHQFGSEHIRDGNGLRKRNAAVLAHDFFPQPVENRIVYYGTGSDSGQSTGDSSYVIRSCKRLQRTRIAIPRDRRAA